MRWRKGGEREARKVCEKEGGYSIVYWYVEGKTETCRVGWFKKNSRLHPACFYSQFNLCIKKNPPN